ncbi:hypothetical protein Acor_12290 [Acrocarpospora corrugata]|uniref:Uncharacterized protein n=1 Tax=Acrocarpospora corrugata TaxID=35763 RepID=A0A5M3VR60_9ACTN|nr:hypothetical protein [Acrocarpospora corrugata]GER99165.1 hypothetical protein Acor_12290 [Acrocarpospora corrugata]
MLIDFRPHARLRADQPVDLMASVAPVVAALADSAWDLSRVRVVCDWVQYRENFRDVVDARPIMSAPGCRPDLEVAVDVRRGGEAALGSLAAACLSGGSGRVYLEDWALGSAGCVWSFNALYWSALELWEKASGRGYEQALPGGESDGRNRDAARELIHELFEVWDSLARSAAIPAELVVVELGVGNGHQAKVFLDEFRRADQARGSDYYRRLHYLMCDYSQHVLDLAGETVAAHAGRVSSVTLDATRPLTSLAFLKHKVFLVYVSNMYDNLPTDEVAQLNGRTYAVETRAYLPSPAAAELADSISGTPGQLPGLVHKLLRLGPRLLTDAAPAHFPDVDSAVEFWRRAWSMLRLEERYVPLAGLDQYAVTAQCDGEALRPLLESGADVRMHVSNGAVASFADSLLLLHPYGRLICHDLFVTGVEGYRSQFRGPGKYDGSVVNWVNGPLIAHVGRRSGFDVHYEPFRHQSAGHIVTMTAQARD